MIHFVIFISAQVSEDPLWSQQSVVIANASIIAVSLHGVSWHHSGQYDLEAAMSNAITYIGSQKLVVYDGTSMIHGYSEGTPSDSLLTMYFM